MFLFYNDVFLFTYLLFFCVCVHNVKTYDKLKYTHAEKIIGNYKS